MRSCLTILWELELEPPPSHRMAIVCASGYVPVPDSLNVVADKLGGIVTDSHCHISDIFCNIVDTVRDYRAVSKCCKVVIEGFQSAVGESFTRPFEVASQFLFLGVNAEDRDADILQRLACSGDVLKLLVPVLYISHRDILAEGYFLKFKVIKYLSDMISGYLMSSLGKFILNLSLGQRDPDHILILRKTGSMRLYDLNCCLNPFRMLGQHSMTPATLSADAFPFDRLA